MNNMNMNAIILDRSIDQSIRENPYEYRDDDFDNISIGKS